LSTTRVLERPVGDAPDPANATTVALARPRVIGVDVARGLALLGMIATHVYGSLDGRGDPTTAHVVAGGRAATTFVLVAGVSLAFLSGGRTAVRGRERVAVSAGLVVRAVLIGALGLALSALSEANGVDVILQFYAVLFLLAIPLLGCAPMVLIGIAAAVTALGPVLLVLTADAGLPYAGSGAEPTFATLVQDPTGLLVQLFVTGEYPVVVYMAYLCVGLAIGRLDLRSPRLAWVLLGAGIALAVAARAASAVLLYPLGGLARLIEQNDQGGGAAEISALLWEAEPSASWWYLALPAPHSHTPIDLLHTLGSAVAVLGAALLLTRIPAVSRVLWPLAAAGAMSLTLYSAHLVVLATGVQEELPGVTLLLMVAGALAFAAAWRFLIGQGPLEAVVAWVATGARRATARLLPPSASSGSPSPSGPAGAGRRGRQFLAPVACAAVLALVFWAGAEVAAAKDAANRDAADVEVADAGDSSLSDLADPDEDPPTGGGDADDGADPETAPPEADATRYCGLAGRLEALQNAHPDQPGVVVEQAGALLAEMPQAAPAEIRDAVTLVVDDLRAEAGVAGATEPDDAALAAAEAAVDAFEEQNC